MLLVLNNKVACHVLRGVCCFLGQADGVACDACCSHALPTIHNQNMHLVLLLASLCLQEQLRTLCLNVPSTLLR